ncbi:MAG TPA: hypothetical protein VFT69_15880 [Pseudolabrys sp.]|nr:hypothetical protein [Pseudolabrys sp.]
MTRSLATLFALGLAVPVLVLPVTSKAIDSPTSMHFALRMEGPAATCGSECRLLVSAHGPITADTPSEFKRFAKGRKLTGALMVLDSEGGSVHGAIKLGREIRALGLDTTVGKVSDLDASGGAVSGLPRASISPHANCESMCAFVLLAGVHRTVPAQARVMVHQIWLGNRRNDPTAATYSAEDLVLVQRDIGRLARYTEDMGASIEVLDLALRIPPWEPMHTMTRAEITRTRMANADNPTPAPANVASSQVLPQAQPAALLPSTNGIQPTQISEQHWGVIDQSGSAALARSQPLTFEGDEIGNFDLMLSCGAGGGYDVSYVEHRHDSHDWPLPAALHAVTIAMGDSAADLKVVSSKHQEASDELVTIAAGTLPGSLIDRFASAGDHSLMVQTRSPGLVTGIRVGNTGAQQSLPQLAAQCAKGIADHADLPSDKINGGKVAAK